MVRFTVLHKELAPESWEMAPWWEINGWVWKPWELNQYLGLSPCPVRVTTRIVMFLVGDPYKAAYKPSFATVTGQGGQPNQYLTWCESPPTLIPKFWCSFRICFWQCPFWKQSRSKNVKKKKTTAIRTTTTTTTTTTIQDFFPWIYAHPCLKPAKKDLIVQIYEITAWIWRSQHHNGVTDVSKSNSSTDPKFPKSPNVEIISTIYKNSGKNWRGHTMSHRQDLIESDASSWSQVESKRTHVTTVDGLEIRQAPVDMV